MANKFFVFTFNLIIDLSFQSLQSFVISLDGSVFTFLVALITNDSSDHEN